MISKKKRSKEMKPKTEDVQTNTANMGACVESVPEKTEISSPFLRLPREVYSYNITMLTKLTHEQVRDKIYDELLVARLSPEEQEKYDQVVAADKTPCGEFGRANALDFYVQDVCLMPGSNQNYP